MWPGDNTDVVSPAGSAGTFDPHSGSAVERLLFAHRPAVVVACALSTIVLAFSAARLDLNASFEKTIPADHAFVANYARHARELKGLGNAVALAVENRKGTIYDAGYLDTLRRISDDAFLIPGVDRPLMKSLWTPATRWIGVTEEGLDGGPVIPDDYDGSPQSIARFRENVLRSGEIGQIVAVDVRSSIVHIPLLATDAQGNRLDYPRFSADLENLRRKYETASIAIHITGFAKIVGDLIDGLRQVLAFFTLAAAIATGIVFLHTRDVRSTLLVVTCSATAVVWQLGLLHALGFSLDPYSMLVPFLVFAIGMSHGAQKMNGITQDIARGAPKLVAARLTFRRLFLAGLAALLADAAGFAVLTVIDIAVIRELAIAASLGVAALIVTNLILLPVLLSYAGVNPGAAVRSLQSKSAPRQLPWSLFNLFTQRRWASGAIACSVILALGGLVEASRLQTGDLEPGAPELRPNSRYNRDVAFMNAAYGAGSDVFAVMVETADGQCAQHDVLMRIDALEWELQQIAGVESTNSLALLNRRVLVSLSEGSFKWYDLIANQRMLNYVTAHAPPGYYDATCALLTVYAYLTDHKAETLGRIVDHVTTFAAANDTSDVKFLLAAGSAGIEAATNSVVGHSWRRAALLVYGIVAVLCFITFRSWRAVLVALLPLMLTSVLVEALMVVLGMGVKVATLPVIALGVGIGVDYALYVLSVMLRRVRAGDSVATAYDDTLRFTGKVVLLTGSTLAVAVATWALSPIKLQADMGVLLAFMFLWNMLGALVLLPALACFLLPPNDRSEEIRASRSPGRA